MACTRGALLLTTTGVRPFSALASGLSLADYAAAASGESSDVCLYCTAGMT